MQTSARGRMRTVLMLAAAVALLGVRAASAQFPPDTSINTRTGNALGAEGTDGRTNPAENLPGPFSIRVRYWAPPGSPRVTCGPWDTPVRGPLWRLRARRRAAAAAAAQTTPPVPPPPPATSIFAPR